MCNILYMKINIKSSILICFCLGTLFYFLSNNKQKTNTIKNLKYNQQNQYKFIDKKASELPAPRPYISNPVPNKLGINSNWKSK